MANTNSTNTRPLTCIDCGEEGSFDDRWYLENGTGVRFWEMDPLRLNTVSQWPLRCECCEEDRREKFSA